jgi:hypothetical protein
MRRQKPYANPELGRLLEAANAREAERVWQSERIVRFYELAFLAAVLPPYVVILLWLGR